MAVIVLERSLLIGACKTYDIGEKHPETASCSFESEQVRE
jgi:hypothetical protein